MLYYRLPLSKHNDITKNVFPEKAEVASVRSILKKNQREKNWKLQANKDFKLFFQRFMKSFFLKSLNHLYINSFLSEYMAAYRENYSINHVWIRLIENWREALDDKFLVGTVLMGLSKVFDCMPHDLLIAKLLSYGFRQK